MSAQQSPVKLGFQCKLYYCVEGIGGTPTWVEAPSVQNCGLDVPLGESDVSIRGGNGYKFTVGTLLDASITVSVPYVPDDAFCSAVITAYFARNILGIAAMDGAIATTGSQGLQADMQVFGFKCTEDVGNNAILEFTLKPTYPTNISGVLNLPSWAVIE